MYPHHKRPYQGEPKVLVDIDSSVFIAAVGIAARTGFGMYIESTGIGVWRGVA